MMISPLLFLALISTDWTCHLRFADYFRFPAVLWFSLLHPKGLLRILEYVEIRFLTEKAFYGSVKPYISVLLLHILSFWLLQSYDFFRLYYFSTQKTKSLLLLSYTASVYRFGWLIIMTVGYWIKLHLSFITLYSLVLAGEGQVLHLSFRDYCCKLLFFSFEIIKGILFVFGSQLSFFLVNPNLFILCVLLITYMIIVCHICDKYLSLLR